MITVRAARGTCTYVRTDPNRARHNILNVGIKVMKSDHNGINMHSCQPINNFVQDNHHSFAGFSCALQDKIMIGKNYMYTVF